MRRTKRWMAATAMVLVVTMAAPATANAATGGRGEAWEGRGVSTTVVGVRIAASSRGLAGWFHGLLSAIWGATRGTIIPGGSGTGDSANTVVDVDLVGGGA